MRRQLRLGRERHGAGEGARRRHHGAEPGPGWEQHAATYPSFAAIKKARDEQGWNVHRVATWEDLVAFARAFSRQHYGRGPQTARPVRPRTPISGTAANGAPRPPTHL
ncbi:hypothetical protein [Verrucomicrobium spinosum]|uniref:hypothetical protein n=1 Tax=Verrucomicrobium spinosum TaxID=2736 RepID=UPI0009467EED|nr:hypothetical protein [Verrucomicrobium spinosum]